MKKNITVKIAAMWYCTCSRLMSGMPMAIEMMRLSEVTTGLTSVSTLGTKGGLVATTTTSERSTT